MIFKPECRRNHAKTADRYVSPTSEVEKTRAPTPIISKTNKTIERKCVFRVFEDLRKVINCQDHR